MITQNAENQLIAIDIETIKNNSGESQMEDIFFLKLFTSAKIKNKLVITDV